MRCADVALSCWGAVVQFPGIWQRHFAHLAPSVHRICVPKTRLRFSNEILVRGIFVKGSLTNVPVTRLSKNNWHRKFSTWSHNDPRERSVCVNCTKTEIGVRQSTCVYGPEVGPWQN